MHLAAQRRRLQPGAGPRIRREDDAISSTKASETNGQISPDGKWVAYASNESGDWEIYVTTFPGAAGKWQVSRGGGTEPRWRGDGKEIFYIGAEGHVDGGAGEHGGNVFAPAIPRRCSRASCAPRFLPRIFSPMT